MIFKATSINDLSKFRKEHLSFGAFVKELGDSELKILEDHEKKRRKAMVSILRAVYTNSFVSSNTATDQENEKRSREAAYTSEEPTRQNTCKVKYRHNCEGENG